MRFAGCVKISKRRPKRLRYLLCTRSRLRECLIEHFHQRVPIEYGGGPVGVSDKAMPGDFDVVSASIVDLAYQLGA